MRQTIRTTLLLSATALFSAACTNMPQEGQDTSYNTGGYSAAPTGNVPEAGPLTADNSSAGSYNPQVAANIPVAAAPQSIPVATVPQMAVPAATDYAQTDNTNNSPYDTYAADNSDYADDTVVDYSQPQNSSNDSYTNYASNAAAADPAVTTYYPDNSGYDSYANNGNSNTGGGAATYSNAAATGSSAVQVFASGSQAKAEQISQNMRSQGLPAVVDMVNGLYKVRVPYPDEGAARANLIRVRQASGEAGAFVTHR